MKKILIISYHFYPDINPRSFRATELAKEFSKMGHNVSVFTKHEIEVDNIKILYPTKKSKFLNTILKVKTLSFTYDVYANVPKDDDYDIVLSVGLPISCHIGTYLYKNFKNKNNNLKLIADYGDPYYTKFSGIKYFILKNVEKFILKKFDYITIPIEYAKPIYEKIVNKDKIKVIPQGVNYKDIKITDYKKNKIITFAYAGLFYKDIRNPTVLMDYLIKLNENFRFIIYTNYTHPDNRDILEKYKDILKEKLVIHPTIPREKCIYELSKADFLIYQNNSIQEQKSSKIIDYMITQRPYFEFDQNNFDAKVFESFLNRDYIGRVEKYKEKLEKYSIEKIAKIFLRLLSSD